MEIKAPVQIAVGLTSARGLAYDQNAYFARSNAFDVGLIAAFLGVELKAGEETPVSVQVPELPPNANVQSISAQLTIISGSAEQKTPVSVSEGGGKPRQFEIGVDSAPGLRNVQVRLQGGKVIWTHAGAAPAGTYDLPDFSADANAYLDQAKITGTTVLQFLVKSETAGAVTISVPSGVTYTLLQTQRWTNELDSTFRVDRNLQLEFNAVEVLVLEPIAEQGAITRSDIRLDAGGQLGPERLLGEVAVFDGRQTATISSDYSLAQQVRLAPAIVKKAVRCTGVSVYAESLDAAELYFELQGDSGGIPASGPPLTKSNVSYKPPEKGASQQWTFAPFASPAELNLDTPYWIVMKAVRGEVKLGLQAPPAGQSLPVLYGNALINRGGERWKCLAPVSAGRVGACDSSVIALAGLVYLPDPDNQTAAVHLLVMNSAAEQRFDPAARVQNLSLDLAGDASKQATLILRSHARGNLTVANVVQEYRRS